MLQANRAVRHHHHRLTFDLEVPVGHRDRRFFVAAGEQLGRLVAAVIDERFVDAAESGAGVGGDVLEAQGLDDVDHEVGARAIRGPHVDVGRRRGGLGSGLLSARQRIRSRWAMNFRRFLRLWRSRVLHQRGSGSGSGRLRHPSRSRDGQLKSSWISP